MNSLIIVESPAKAKTINKILGKEFSVKASVGHVKDLPQKEIGVDVEKEFEPRYVVIPGKEKIIRELKKASAEADIVFLAPDPDREGEAIAWHIATEINSKKAKTKDGKIYRIIFNEITERAVKEAIKNPKTIDMNKVEAQQARRILDRLVGYGLSPLLWRKVRRGLSAGRVQSVAVKLVVDKEREIEAFKSEEYWSINAEFEGSAPPPFRARLARMKKEGDEPEKAGNGKFLIRDDVTAGRVLEDLRDKEFILRGIEKKQRKRMPYPPFITSTLQQEAVRKLRFPTKKTMMIAQQLYEGIELGEEGSVGLITYMRTDSHRIAPEAQQWAREFITMAYGKEYVPEKPPFYKSKATAQEAHEAIRPTYPQRSPASIKRFLSKDQISLYSLIWNRFIASQMSPAQLEQTSFAITSSGRDGIPAGYELRAAGTTVRFEGFTVLYTEGRDDIEEENGMILPPLKEGEKLVLKDVVSKQHFTQPPPRYTEATLVKALEEKAIGRPSTYAAILSTIQDRKYVQKTDGKFSPTELGILVNDYLVEKFSDLMDVGFTAKMEDELDRIEDGRMKWVKVVNDFYGPFGAHLDEAIKTTGKVKPEDIPTEEVCEKCGSPMVIRWGRHGRFLACSGFPKCRNARPIQGEEQPERREEQIVKTDEKCEKCGSEMVIKSGRFGKFLACSRYPECKTTRPLATGIKCPLDGGDVVERRSKKGKQFWSCSNYPECRFASWYKPVPKNCPGCGAAFLLEKRDRNGNVIIFCQNKECGYKVTERAGEEETELVTTSS
jgi:DNA topoisomerase I